MRALLGDGGFRAYEESFLHPPHQALRVNTLKLSPDAFLERKESEAKGEALPGAAPGGLLEDRVPWCQSAFYYSGETSAFSKHPDYQAGLYYLQEPSAMAPAQLLPVEEGDRVLDLCAAPGGKSTALAEKLKGTGLLVSNDISASRAKALLKNLELFGVKNAFTISEAPYRLSLHFPGYFDKILVDAPCSGEGMFHKEPEIMKNWAQYGNEYYAKLQKEILGFAYAMLKPGGMLLYSTCTFHPMEDEGQIQDFLLAHPDMELVRLDAPAPDFSRGYASAPSLGLSAFPEGERCLRLWPHLCRGQGHFIALMQKSCEDRPEIEANGAAKGAAPSKGGPKSTYSAEELSAFQEFCERTLSAPWHEILGHGILVKLGSLFYLSPQELSEEELSRFNGLRVLRGGLLLGEVKKDRFEPSQALAMALRSSDVSAFENLSFGDERLSRYLRGESIDSSLEGWGLVLAEGFPLGWGKGVQGRLKNKLLKGWISH